MNKTKRNAITITVELTPEMFRCGAQYDEDGGLISGGFETVEEALAAAVAAQLAERFRPVLDRTAKEALEKSIREAADKAIEDAVAGEIQKVLDEGVPETTRYGEPTGRRVSIATQALEFLSAKDGSFRDSKRRIDKMIEEMVTTAFHKEIAAEVEQARAYARKLLDDGIWDRIRAAIKDAAR